MIVDVDFKPVQLQDNSWGVAMFLGHKQYDSVLASRGEALTFKTKEEAQNYIEEELY